MDEESSRQLLEDCEHAVLSMVDSDGMPYGIPVNFVFERDCSPQLFAEPKIGNDRSGSGDVFASVILADAVNGVPFAESVQRASNFVAKAVARTVELGIPEQDGLAIEEVLTELISCSITNRTSDREP